MSDPQQQDLGAGALPAGDVTAVIVGAGWRGSTCCRTPVMVATLCPKRPLCQDE